MLAHPKISRPGPGKPYKAGTYSFPPRGEPKYTVRLNPDGSIKVRQGDWVSKYAACLYLDDKAGWGDFGHKNPKTGAVEPLPDPNRIYVNQTLYHLPSRRAGRKSEIRMTPVVVEGKAWTQFQVKLDMWFVKTGLGVPVPGALRRVLKAVSVTGLAFRARLSVRFSDEPGRLYAWDSVDSVLASAGPRFKWPSFDAGAIATGWSDPPAEFRYHLFDPRDHWQNMDPSMTLFLKDVKGRSRLTVFLDWAFLPLSRRWGHTRNTGARIDRALEASMPFDKASGNPFPNLEYGMSLSRTLTNFRKIK